jgi:opacity protein-like surface antigen
MKKKPLVAASLVLALSAAAAPSAVSAVTENPTSHSSISHSETESKHSDKFAEAMSTGKTSTESNEGGAAEPFAVPAVAAGIAAKEGAKWAGKQVAKGALTEAGKKLIGIW